MMNIEQLPGWDTLTEDEKKSARVHAMPKMSDAKRRQITGFTQEQGINAYFGVSKKLNIPLGKNLRDLLKMKAADPKVGPNVVDMKLWAKSKGRK